MTTPRVIEGVFAVNKPKSLSSAQVVRDIQQAFNPSKLFAPWLDAERARRSRENNNQRRRRKDKNLQVKVGHGGTLDPMATGVLIIGVGRGTKQLQNFLGCTKIYEASVLFGAATDSYDVLGRILSKAPYNHITREKVEEALKKFRGSIEQKPPLYSALHMDGKRLYEYAREGKEIPREIKARPVRTESLELREWLPAGCHQYRWPDEEVANEERDIVDQVLHLGAASEALENDPRVDELLPDSGLLRGTKRGRDSDDEEKAVISRSPLNKRLEMSPAPVMSGAIQEPFAVEDECRDTAANTVADAQTGTGGPSHSNGPPAAKLSMTVTSGFYVRSLCHDLGQELGSLGIMSELVRTKQSDFELGRNVLEYADLRKGEDVWAPQVEQMLVDWQGKMDSETSGDDKQTRSASQPGS
ncbi:MAG: hypothetical protein Q9181_000181 [Wetmoreana brouardii]